MLPTDPAAGAALAGLSSARRRPAVDRYRKLRPHLEEGVPLHRVAAQAGFSLRTAQRWVSRYRRFGLAGLSRAARADQGKRRRLSDELRRHAEGLALQTPAPSPASIYRDVCRVARTKGQQPPRYHTVYNVIRALPQAPRIGSFDREEAGHDAYDLVHRREAERPNQIWHAGHMRVDCWVSRGGGGAARPWLTAIIDDYSRVVAGFFFSFARPTAVQTGLALHQAICDKSAEDWAISGIPEVLYVEDVNDFRSAPLARVAAEIGMGLFFANTVTPRGRRRIATFFETVDQMFVACLRRSSIGAAVLPDPGENRVELDRRFLQLLDAYHARPHGETKVPPLERWRRGGFVLRNPQTPEQLDPLLLAVARPRTIRSNGVRFMKRRYVDRRLAAYGGQTVLLRYDPREPSEVRLFHEHKFLCCAVCPELGRPVI